MKEFDLYPDSRIMLNHGLLNETQLVEFTQNINWKPNTHILNIQYLSVSTVYVCDVDQ